MYLDDNMRFENMTLLEQKQLEVNHRCPYRTYQVNPMDSGNPYFRPQELYKPKEILLPKTEPVKLFYTEPIRPLITDYEVKPLKIFVPESKPLDPVRQYMPKYNYESTTSLIPEVKPFYKK
jgi:hypothetical protein